MTDLDEAIDLAEMLKRDLGFMKVHVKPQDPRWRYWSAIIALYDAWRKDEEIRS